MKVTAVLIALIILLSACSTIDSDELYRLPKPPKDFLKLQQKIDTLLSSGGEYAPPQSGNNRQVQQTVDLTGSGVSEILVFMRFQGEKPLRIYIFHLEGNDYVEMDMISEDAESIHSIHYSDLDGDGMPEVLVGWQVAMLKTLSVYKLQNGRLVEYLSTSFTELSVFDMLGKGRNDLLVIRHDAAGFTGSSQLFYFEDGEIISLPQASMSKGVQSIVRIKSGLLADGSPALYVASHLDRNAIVTDVFTVREGHFFNVSLNPESEISDETMRYNDIYAADLDGDSVVDLPSVFPLPGHEAVTENNDYWGVDWRNYDTFGRIYYKFTTYHSPNDGWYILMPDDWKYNFTVTNRSISSTVRTTTLAYYKDGNSVDLCEVYCFTGDNRVSQAEQDGRFKLGEKTDVVFAAKLLPGAESAYVLTSESLASMFSLIENKWITGEIED